MQFTLFWASAKRLSVFVVGAHYEPAKPNPPLALFFSVAFFTFEAAPGHVNSHFIGRMGNVVEAVNERYST